MDRISNIDLREQTRILERNLGLLKKNGKGCCQAVTMTQCHTLVEIGRAKKISLKELAAILSLDTSTTSRAVDSLVEKNLVERILASFDRRSVEISLTNSGISLFDEIESTMNEEYARILGYIPEDKQWMVVEALGLLNDAFKANDLQE